MKRTILTAAFMAGFAALTCAIIYAPLETVGGLLVGWLGLICWTMAGDMVDD